MSSSRARHRAPVARLAWASRALLAAASVPVGALAGCAVAAVSSSADRPEVGIAGLAAAGVPLGVHGWRQRTRRSVVRGRHAALPAGVAEIWPTAVAAAAEVAGAAAEVVEAPRYLTVRLEAPAVTVRAVAAVPRQREAARVVTVPAGPAGPVPVEVERATEVAELQRIWDAGTGPDTGPVAVPAPADAVAAVALAGDVRRRQAA